MDEVLILGNGISRLKKDDMVRSWPGEVWGCNRAYEEFPDKLSRLTGHTEVLKKALLYQDQHKSASFEIWSGHVGKPVSNGKAFTCPAEFLCDSGTTLVAQALEEGRSVAVLGFDLGGWDIHSPGIEKSDKSSWVRRWRKLAKHYGLERVRFIGYNHKPFILSGKDAAAYALDYQNNAPHINDPEYIKTWEKWTGRSIKKVLRTTILVRVVFNNGYETDMNEVVADLHIRKDLVKLVEDKPKKGEKKK